MSTITAIILAAGQGKRMNTSTSKQYLMLRDKPILAYAIEAFENSQVDNIILVCPKTDLSYCKTEIVEKYNYRKVTHIIEGGQERYHSVFNGLKQCSNSDYVLIHDGVRPFITADLIDRCIENVKKYKACILGVPVKDTIKLAGQDKYVEESLDRSKLWSIQTPQAFEYQEIYKAYTKYMEEELTSATDDAMVYEEYRHTKVKIVMGDYSNIKITTVEDLWMADAILQSKTDGL